MRINMPNTVKKILNLINAWIYVPIEVLLKSKNYRFDSNYRKNNTIDHCCPNVVNHPPFNAL